MNLYERRNSEDAGRLLEGSEWFVEDMCFCCVVCDEDGA